MKKNLLLLGIALMLVGCGPSYTVVQSGLKYTGSEPGLVPPISVRVLPSRQSPYSKEYAPKVLVQNVSDQPVIISSVELFAEGVRYQNSAPTRYPESYPQSIAPNAEVPLPARFKLASGLEASLANQTGELRVRFRARQEGLASVSLRGDREMTRP